MCSDIAIELELPRLSRGHAMLPSRTQLAVLGRATKLQLPVHAIGSHRP